MANYFPLVLNNGQLQQLRAADSIKTNISVDFPALSILSYPSVPNSGFRIFADSSNKFSWIGANGHVRTFDGTGNTGDRTYTLPDASGYVGLLAGSSGQIPFNSGSNTYNAVSNLSWDNSTKTLSVIGTNLFTANNQTDVVLTLKGASGQSGKLLRLISNSGTEFAYFAANGQLNINSGSAVDALTIGQSYNANCLVISKGGGVGTCVLVTNASAQADNINLSLSDSQTYLINKNIIGVKSSVTTSVDPFSIKAGEFYATSGRTTQGSNPDLVYGIDVKASSGISSLGTAGYAGNFICGNLNIVGVQIQLAASQASNGFQIIDNSNNPKFAIQPDSGLRISNSSSASTLGTVTAKMPIYNASGTLLGYIPIYSSIT